MVRAEKKISGIAVIGLGTMGKNHLEGWSRCPAAKIIAVCDTRIDARLSAQKKYAIPYAESDYKKAIANPAVDIVSVCTHVPLHEPIVRYALQQKKHVLCEKPLTLSVAKNVSLAKKAKQQGVVLAVGFQSRAADTLEVIRKILARGELGSPVYYLHQNIRAPIDPIYHDEDGNGGPLVDLYCHFFDFWKILFGSSATRVFATGSVFGRDKKELRDVKRLAYDTFNAQIEFANGNLGLVNNCWGLPKQIKDDWGAAKHNEIPVGDWLWGPKGIICGGVRDNEIIIRRENRQDVTYVAKRNLGENQYAYIKNVLAYIRSGKGCIATADDATDALKISVAIKRSIDTGRLVKIK